MDRSEGQSAIGKALVAACADLSNPSKSAENPFFKSKYAPLPDILNHVKPVLTSHGLCAVQDANGAVLLLHSSGEWIEFGGMDLKPDKETPQGYVAALTYARRATLAAALGIAADEDDDGNAISGNQGPSMASQGTTRHGGAGQPALSSEKQQKMIYAKAKGYYESDFDTTFKPWLSETFGTDDTRKLTSQQASEVIDFLKGLGA